MERWTSGDTDLGGFYGLAADGGYIGLSLGAAGVFKYGLSVEERWHFYCGV
jgi:hypothetical protein